MIGQFWLFVNVKQAARFGHVGWGFQLEDETFMFGATDHLYRHHEMDLAAWIDYMSVAPGEHTDWWCGFGTREKMLEAMTDSREHIWYHKAKGVKVANCDPRAARKAAEFSQHCGWSVLSNNCVQQTWEIVRAYGADRVIPNPWDNAFNLIPRVWFKSFEGETVELNPNSR